MCLSFFLSFLLSIHFFLSFCLSFFLSFFQSNTYRLIRMIRVLVLFSVLCHLALLLVVHGARHEIPLPPTPRADHKRQPRLLRIGTRLSSGFLLWQLLGCATAKPVGLHRQPCKIGQVNSYREAHSDRGVHTLPRSPPFTHICVGTVISKWSDPLSQGGSLYCCQLGRSSFPKNALATK